ncbi:MAG: terminase family protein [Oscillospiraceae bacterium]|nr:terminase family protein [Oscillospiraceae bacterium]
MTRSAKSSTGEQLMGKQEPSARVAPPYRDSDGYDAAQIVAAGGLLLDPWQQNVLDDWMSRNAAGRWAAQTCGGSVPRQNGKTLLIEARAAAGMLLCNEQVIYTAHLQKTATETFEELAGLFDTPALKRYLKEIKTALGREQIILKNGARVKFLARTRNGGRGQHGDLLLFDEAQELDENQQASFLPAISASLNPQTIYVGTPPDSVAIGTVFRAIRARALAGKSEKTAWFEFSVPEIGDTSDRQRWADTNPALGRRILMSTVEGEIEQLDEDVFARERLGWWSPPVSAVGETAIEAEAWAACASLEQKPEGKTAYGIKFTADGSEVILAGAVIPKAGKARISLIERRHTVEGVRWLADWLNARYDQAACVVIDGKNGVDVLIDRISGTWRAKNSVIRLSARDYISAVGLLVNEINEQSLTWYKPQEQLNNSATTSTRRNIGGSGWGFGGENSAPIEACSLALWGAKNARRDPSRKMRIG